MTILVITVNMADTIRPWYSSAEAQQAFLALPEDDQHTLELKHRIEADVMHTIYRVEDMKVNLSSEKSIFLKSINDLDVFSDWQKNSLDAAEIFYLWQLVSLPNKTEDETAQRINIVLKTMGATLWMSIPEDDIKAFSNTFRNTRNSTIEKLPKQYKDAYLDNFHDDWVWTEEQVHFSCANSIWQGMKIRNSNELPGINYYFNPIRSDICGEPLFSVLRSNGIYYYGQISHFTDKELCNMPWMNQEKIQALEKLCELGFVLPYWACISDKYIDIITRMLFTHEKIVIDYKDFKEHVMISFF